MDIWRSEYPPLLPLDEEEDDDDQGASLNPADIPPPPPNNGVESSAEEDDEEDQNDMSNAKAMGVCVRVRPRTTMYHAPSGCYLARV